MNTMNNHDNNSHQNYNHMEHRDPNNNNEYIRVFIHFTFSYIGWMISYNKLDRILNYILNIAVYIINQVKWSDIINEPDGARSADFSWNLSYKV